MTRHKLASPLFLLCVCTFCVYHFQELALEANGGTPEVVRPPPVLYTITGNDEDDLAEDDDVYRCVNEWKSAIELQILPLVQKQISIFDVLLSSIKTWFQLEDMSGNNFTGQQSVILREKT